LIFYSKFGAEILSKVIFFQFFLNQLPALLSHLQAKENIIMPKLNYYIRELQRLNAVQFNKEATA
jgi:hypothetical protein